MSHRVRRKTHDRTHAHEKKWTIKLRALTSVREGKCNSACKRKCKREKEMVRSKCRKIARIKRIRMAI